MQTIYIDVTNLTSVSFLTGVQRVVRNVSGEMYKTIPDRLCFIAFDDQEGFYKVLDSENFVKYLEGNKNLENKIFSGKNIGLSDMKPGDIFFEIDAGWNMPYKRSVLLPKLKRYGVKIAVYVYDILPIILPQYTHIRTRLNFTNYIGAYLQYADVIIASAQSTLDAINDLSDKLGLKRIPGFVSWLGSSFESTESEEDIPEEVKKAASGKYILNVGTIEPRKNHALLLDAFDNCFFDKGINLIFAGRIGWNIEDLKKRIENHPRLNEQLFHFTGLSDTAINYLYSHAYMVAFPSFNEGFGLPIIESLERGTPVLSADVPVLREVGKDYCEYFSPYDYKDFINKLSEYLDSPDKYEKTKETIKSFKSFSWKETSDRIINALDTLKKAERKPLTDVSQMVILTARVNDISRSIPFIEENMQFINKLLLCCPSKVAEDMKNISTKRVSIEVLTDEEILCGAKLPEDHGTRNFFLRCLVMKSPKADDVFIMSDDDYRPIKPVDIDFFVNENSYKAYYCYMLEDWKGMVGNQTSYDRYIFRTRDFVNENRYPGYMYSSHMPQIIDKALYRMMIEEHAGIENTGLDEWSSYFNFVQAKYPDLIESKPYVTLCWPGLVSDWDMKVEQSDYVFENFYEASYQKGNVFEGLNPEFNANSSKENKIKIERITQRNNEYFDWKNTYDRYCRKIKKDRLEIPSFGIYTDREEILIGAPESIELPAEAVIHMPFTFVGNRPGLSLQMVISNEKAAIIKTPVIDLKTDELKNINNRFDAVLICGEKGTRKGNYSLTVRIDDGNNTIEKSVALKLT